MYTFYAFIAGPLAWIACIVFIGGLLFQLVTLIIQAYRSERFIFTHFSLRYGLRSISHWLLPFGTVNWRRHPLVTVATFCFHICSAAGRTIVFLRPLCAGRRCLRHLLVGTAQCGSRYYDAFRDCRMHLLSYPAHHAARSPLCYQAIRLCFSGIGRHTFYFGHAGVPPDRPPGGRYLYTYDQR